MLEWQQIDSTRELWPAVYNQPQLRRDESLLQLSARLVLFDSTD
jgi:hypothetical protein